MSANGAATGELVATPSAGTTVETGFGKQSVATHAETAATAMATAAKTAIEAAYIMAMRKPRNFDQVRALLLKACEHPAFAEMARFRKPVGKELNEETGEWENKIAEGLSIRFAEEAARTMGNLDVNSFTIYDDPKKKIVRFVVVDLENNTTWGKTVTIERTTERQKLKENQQALGTRMNSYGKLVFVVEATPAEVAKAEGAEASKAWRDQILKSLPAYIKGECLKKINEVLLNDAAEDPDKKKKLVLDSFAGIGVLPVHLEDYLAHGLDMISPAEIANLRTLYASIDQGETTWAVIMEQRRETREANKAEAKTGQPATGKGAVDAAAKAAREKREAAEKAAAEKKADGKPASVATATTATPAATKPAAPGAKPVATDPASLITTGKVTPAATTVPPAAEAKPAAPPAAEFVMSTSKQRTELVRALTEAQLGLHEVTEKYGVPSLAELSHVQCEEALAWVRSVTGEVKPDPNEGP